VLFSVAAFVLAACRDSSAPTERRTIVPGDRSSTISDGAHTNGNDDVWFLPPMVSNPQGSPGYGDPFQPGLPVVYVIRDMTANGNVVRTLAAQADGEMYQANWDTKSDNLISSHTYRIEVTIAQKVLAFADVSKDGDGMKNNGTQQAVQLNGNRTLPIKVRIEKGWNCVNNNSCVSQVVPPVIPPGQKIVVTSPDGNNMAAFSGDWFDPNQAGTSNVVVTIEDVSSQYTAQPNGCSLGLTKENAQGVFGLSTQFCVRISIEPHVVLTQPVVIGLCREHPGDERQMVLKYDVGETPKFLRESAPPSPCPVSVGAVTHERNPLKRLAAAVFSGAGTAVNWALGVKPAYAIHLGVGGLVEIGDDFSVFTLGLPATMVPVTGDNQFGLAGAALPVRPTVRVLAVHDTGGPTHPAGVTGAGVTCQVTSGTGGGLFVGNAVLASAPATELPSNDGTYECPSWVLSQAAGANTLKVTSARLDATIQANLDGTVVTLPGEVTFNASGAAITSVGVTPATPSLLVGQTQQLTANVVQSGGAPTTVNWSSSNPSVATVSGAGLVTAVAAGTASISATSAFDATKSGSAAITVNVAPAVQSVTTNTPSAQLPPNAQVSLTASVQVVGGAPETVTWFSSNNFVATVNGATGVVTAGSPGTAIITARSTFDQSKTGTTTINVLSPPVISLHSTVQDVNQAGQKVDRYQINTINAGSFPSVMFAAAANLPPCGQVTSASRSWVTFFDGGNNPLQTFCVLPAALSDPTGLFVGVPRWSQPPAAVHYDLVDRLAGFTYSSNSIALFGPVFDVFPRSFSTDWPAVPNAATYTVTVQFCDSWPQTGDWRNCNNPWHAWTTNTIAAPTTSFQSGFVGAQPGRWQVTAVDANGQPIVTSQWFYFKYIV